MSLRLLLASIWMPPAARRAGLDRLRSEAARAFGASEPFYDGRSATPFLVFLLLGLLFRFRTTLLSVALRHMVAFDLGS